MLSNYYKKGLTKKSFRLGITEKVNNRVYIGLNVTREDTDVELSSQKVRILCP